MFKNVGRKIRGVAIAFFVLLCIASLLVLVAGIVNGIMLEWAWPIIYGVIGAAVGFVLSLIATYMLYGYGTLVKSCEENARINAEILAILRNNNFNCAQPEKPVKEVTAQPEKPEACFDGENEDVKVYEVASDSVAEETVEETAEEIAEEVVEEITTEAVEEKLESVPAAEPIEDPFVEDIFSDRDNGRATLPKQSEPIIKRCPSCGNAVRAQANFCNQCGYKMK